MKAKKENPIKKMMFITYDGEDGGKLGNPSHYSMRCPGCKKTMEDFNTRTNAFECECGLNWKLIFSPAGKKLVKKTTVKERKNG